MHIHNVIGGQAHQKAINQIHLPITLDIYILYCSICAQDSNEYYNYQYMYTVII